MILSPISYLDCLVYCILLAPQLIIHVGVFETISIVLQCLPFLLLELPYSFIRERYFCRYKNQSPFVREASPFEDFVIRCVRYAFANIQPSVGRIFFSKPVALPFSRFRMLRHGYIKFPVHWHEHQGERFKGIWILQDPMKRPDLCVYYIHGGGFAMGSSYFYLEFLLSWLDLLKRAGYDNPSIFALEYTLVPDNNFPEQLKEAIAGYEHVLSTVDDPSRVCVSGDSAGATLALSLLLHLASKGRDLNMDGVEIWRLAKPGFAVLISPWVTLVSDRYHNTLSDYLDTKRLHTYAEAYAGGPIAQNDFILSPGQCRDISWWHRACPLHGLSITLGSDEIFAPEIGELVQFWKRGGIKVTSRGSLGSVHAWPVAALFLSDSSKRLEGLKAVVQDIRINIQNHVMSD
ncbi:Alpha/Beta hydrolase protein [Nemania sp. FL0916]|nr:Alpha/Beta hydrolase protein [Nemania sp. FL0916]